MELQLVNINVIIPSFSPKDLFFSYKRVCVMFVRWQFIFVTSISLWFTYFSRPFIIEFEFITIRDTTPFFFHTLTNSDLWFESEEKIYDLRFLQKLWSLVCDKKMYQTTKKAKSSHLTKPSISQRFLLGEVVRNKLFLCFVLRINLFLRSAIKDPFESTKIDGKTSLYKR